MKISRLSVVTLGVADLGKATAFYEKVLATPPNRSFEGVIFIELPGTWLSLYPLEALAHDISPAVAVAGRGFSGITLAHNVGCRDDVIATLERARAAGARIMKEPQDTFWGGFSGYFADLDGYYWEVAWGPMFAFADNGELRLKEKP